MSSDYNRSPDLVKPKAKQKSRSNTCIKKKSKDDEQMTSTSEETMHPDKENCEEKTHDVEIENSTQFQVKTDDEERSKQKIETDWNLECENIMDMLDKELDKICIMYPNKNKENS